MTDKPETDSVDLLACSVPPAAALGRAACAECPFRVGSQVCYDADALEALEDGAEPSCHMVVGMDSIFFAEPPTDKQRCTGHDRWIDGAEGFREPSGAGPLALAVPVPPPAAPTDKP